MAGALDQHGVIVRSNNGTGKSVTTIKTDTVTTCRAVHLDLSGVRSEALGGIFGSDTALNGETAGGNAVLRQSELGKRRTSSNLNLSSNNIDAGDFLGDGVLDLAVSKESDRISKQPAILWQGASYILGLISIK
jgi:hypothetical protein